MKPILVTSGEPAGVGPDLCLALADSNIPVIILGDLELFKKRSKLLKLGIKFNLFNPLDPHSFKNNYLNILHIPLNSEVTPGLLNKAHAPYVISQLKLAAKLVMNSQFPAIVTAPIHKGIINDAGIKFTGHTEFFQEAAEVGEVVMMLACPQMRLTTVTTHLPLKQVADAINTDKIIAHTKIVANALKTYFNCPDPKILISGLNPHAGEAGHLGSEEQDIIIPAIKKLQTMQLTVHGPYSADTMFSPKHMQQYDAFITMYHDQGLPVIKTLSFGSTVNITLGLPFIRTSVDHGTALDIAGTGKASPISLYAAVKQAFSMALGEAHL